MTHYCHRLHHCSGHKWDQLNGAFQMLAAWVLCKIPPVKCNSNNNNKLQCTSAIVLIVPAPHASVMQQKRWCDQVTKQLELKSSFPKFKSNWTGWISSERSLFQLASHLVLLSYSKLNFSLLLKRRMINNNITQLYLKKKNEKWWIPTLLVADGT